MKIITLVGPSGVGKSTLAKYFFEHHNFHPLLSISTREVRPTELQGEIEHITPQEFQTRAQQKAFMWATEIFGNQYALQFSDIDKALTQAEPSVMAVVPDKVPLLHAYAPGKVLSFYLLPPSLEELERRLKDRQETPEQLQRRLNDIHEWEKIARTQAHLFHFLENTSTEELAAAVLSYL